MPLARPIESLMRRADPLTLPARYGAALGLVGVAFVLRLALGVVLDEGALPFLTFFPAILAASAVLASGAGYVAAAASAVAGAFFMLPEGRIAIDSAQGLLSLAAFVAAACLCACVCESLANALRARDVAERGRRLALEEFRHRTRNDLQSLTSLLLLRARRASPETRAALREAAGHALGLAKIHSRLTQAAVPNCVPRVDTRAFLHGLCSDLAASASADGLRPVALDVEAESHLLTNERAVTVGLVVNEAVTNALKYAWPSAEHSGRVRVSFSRDGGQFVLVVEDDGVGMAALSATQGVGTDGLGTRLLRALAAQLRGTFTRGPAHGDFGTLCLLRFPAAEPGSAG